MGYYPQELSPSFDILQGQFVLTAHENLLPDGWPVASHGRWMVAFHAPLRCVPLRNESGQSIGWLIGDALDQTGTLVSGPAGLRLDPPGDFPGTIEGLTGRFLSVDLSNDSAPQLLGDAFGMLGVVYAPEADCVASSSTLIPLTSGTGFDLERIRAADIPYRSAMYPLGLTPRRGVERLLPNHSLDLSTWRQTRRWPTVPYPRDLDPETAVAPIANQIRRSLEGIRTVWPLELSLTAGLDSRLLLACARGLVSDTLFTTVQLDDPSAWRDVQVARRLAERFGLQHEVLRWHHPRRNDRKTWVLRTGGEAGEVRAWRASRTVSHHGRGRASITGHLGEMARASWWSTLAPEARLTSGDILRHCRVPARPEFVGRAEQWLAGLPELDGIALAGLLYLEQRGGCWAGPLSYGELGDSALRLTPLCQAQLVRDLLRLPDDYRRRAGLHHDIIRMFWPELLELPFNRDFAMSGPRLYYYRTKTSLRVRYDRVMGAVRHWRKRRRSR